MGFFNMFKGAGKKVQREIRKFESNDVLDSFIGASLLMSVAETKGAPTAEAVDVIKRRVKVNPSTSHFDTSDVNEIINKYVGLFTDGGYNSARLNIIRSLHNIRDNIEQSEDVLSAVISEAERDGTISEPEVEMLELIGQELNLNPANYIG